MFNALMTMNGTSLKERSLRVKRAVQKEKLEKKFKKVAERKLNKKGYTPPQHIKRGFKGDYSKLAKKSRKARGPSTIQNDKQKDDARKFHFKRKMIKK